MSQITITINHQVIACQEGESILNIARREGIELPAICYLSGCSPTMACKLCMIDADGKRSYGCNTKAKEGMNVLTHTDEIIKERNAIMQSYDINHPLQCGVCDKSGECELQNYTLKMEVTSQHYHIKESHKAHKSWAKATYDPNLCIMCERCVTTCKDNLGEANLKAQKAELEPLDMALWKEKMPKDALSVWARKQKALIDFVGAQPCYDCGECISVCPVGALSTNDFKYKANAWELKKIESTCTHCPMCCKIIYEVRHNDTLGTPHIYRVKNDFYFNPICGAGRYGYDITSSANPTQNLDEAIAAFKRAKAIVIGDQSTNEEAFVLNHLAKTLQIPLHNQTALHFKQFIHHYLTHAHSNALNHLGHLDEANAVVILGSDINTAVPTLRYKINNKLKIQKGTQVVYMHPISETLMPSLSKSLRVINYHPSALTSAALGITFALLSDEHNTLNQSVDSELQELLKPLLSTQIIEQKSRNKQVKEQVNRTNEAGENITEEITKEVVETYQETNFQALSLCHITQDDLKALRALENPLIVLGADLYEHPQSTELARLFGILEHKGLARILCIPPFSNALGLAMICDLAPLDSSSNAYTIGFRAKGDYRLDSDYVMQESIYAKNKSHDGMNLKENTHHSQHTLENSCIQKRNMFQQKYPDFVLPALNQMEGTYTSLDSRILPLKPALPFDGYDLSDIAKAFGMKGDYLIDYTSLVCGCEFDDFGNSYLNDGSNMRGYRFKNLPLATLETQAPQAISLSLCEQKHNAFLSYSPSQFNYYTAHSTLLQNKIGIYVSATLLDELGLTEGDELTLKDMDSHTIKGRVYINHYLQSPYFLINPLLEGTDYVFSQSQWATLTPTHKEQA